MSTITFPPVPESPYVFEKHTYNIHDTAYNIKERIEHILTEVSAQFMYDEDAGQFYFHFYSPQKSEGYINCFSVSEAEHKIEFQRLDGEQLSFYTELYKVLHALELRNNVFSIQEPELCGLYYAPIKETLISLSWLSSRKMCTRLCAIKSIYENVTRAPSVMVELCEYAVFELLQHGIQDCDSTEMYRYTALVMKAFYGDNAFCEAVDLNGVQRREHIMKTCAAFENLTFGDVLSRREIDRIINVIKEV